MDKNGWIMVAFAALLLFSTAFGPPPPTPSGTPPAAPGTTTWQDPVPTSTTGVSLIKMRDPATNELSFWIFVFSGTETDLRTTPDYQQRSEIYINQWATARTPAERETARQRILDEVAQRVATGYTSTLQSVQNAQVGLYYFDSSSRRHEITDCGEQPMPLRTTNILEPEAPSAASPGTPPPAINPADNVYYARCDIRPEVYDNLFRGTCRVVQATYVGDAGQFRASSTADEVCDNHLSGIPAFSTDLRALVEPTPSNYLTLFAAFLLGGLLLASMYFSGRSPLSLLDIATPRLPSPKAIIPSGQVLGPYGSTELKGATRKMMSADAKIFRTEARILGAKLGAGVMANIDKMTARVGTTGTWRQRAADRMAGDLDTNRDFFRGLAVMAAKYGIPFEHLNLNQHIYRYTGTEQKALADILAKIEAQARASGSKREEMLAQGLRRYMIAVTQYAQWEGFTGHRKAGERVMEHQAVQFAIAKSFGHFKLLRPHMSGMYDSFPRGGWQFLRFGKAVGAEVARRAIETKRAVQGVTHRKGWARNAPVSTPVESSPMVMGTISRMDQKNGYLYKTIYNEAHRDMMRYALVQMFKAHGVELRMKDMEMLEMGYKDKDVLHMAGIPRDRSSAFFAMEREIRDAIRHRNPDGTLVDAAGRVKELLHIAERYNVKLDHNGIVSAIQRLQEIEGMGRTEDVGHVKLLKLMDYLQKEHGINNPEGHTRIGDDRFTFLIGRDTIPNDRVWELFALRTYIHDLENGYMERNVGGKFELKDGANIQSTLKGCWLNVVNRLSTLGPDAGVMPAFANNPAEMQAIRQRAARYMGELMTPEGRKKLDELLTPERQREISKNAKGDADAAALSTMFMMLYGKEEMEQRYQLSGKIKEGGSNLLGGREKGGKAHWWGSPEELGPDASWWKVDMKRHWVDAPGKDFALLEWVEKRFTKSYLPHYKADIERELNAREIYDPVQRGQEARKLLARDLLVQDIREFGNSIWAQNAYGTFNDMAKYQTKTTAGILMAALRRADPTHYHDADTDIRFLRQGFDPANREHRQRLAQLLQDHAAEFQRFIASNVTYDTIAKSDMAWVMTHEGAFAPWVKGMPLSDFDRVYGYTAIHDQKNNMWRRWDPDSQKIDFGPDTFEYHGGDEKFKGKRVGFNEFYGAVSRDKDPGEWKGFLDAAKNWAGSDYERQKVFNGVLFHYANTTNDWKGFWEHSDLQVRPKHEVAPLPPTIHRFFTSADTWLGAAPAAKAMQATRNVGLEVGHSLSRIWQEAASEITASAYATTAYSEYLREHSWRMTEAIKRGNWADGGLTSGLSDKEAQVVKQAYMAAADTHPEYHQYWDWVVDRHPGRSSTAYGSRHRWGAFFHFGPYGQYEMQHTYEATMSRAELATSEALFWPMRPARRLSYYVTSIFRPVQEAAMGAVGKWDNHESALKRYEHINPRFGEALRTFLNPIAAAERGPFGLHEIGFKSSTVQHDMSGRRLAGGLKVAPQDVSYIRGGTYSAARTGEANPGVSTYNFRYMLHMDPAMAEYLANRSTHKEFFANDPYVKEQAMQTLVKREVDSLALALERERELRGFSVIQNPIWGWFSPATFVFHGAGGVLPWWMTPKELVTQGVKRMKQGGFQGQFFQEVLGFAEGFYHGTKQAFTPQHDWRRVNCPMCGAVTLRGEPCWKSDCRWNKKWY